MDLGTSVPCVHILHFILKENVQVMIPQRFATRIANQRLIAGQHSSEKANPQNQLLRDKRTLKSVCTKSPALVYRHESSLNYELRTIGICRRKLLPAKQTTYLTIGAMQRQWN